MHEAAPDEKIASYLKYEYVKLLGRGVEGAAHLMRNGWVAHEGAPEKLVCKVTKLTPNDKEEADVAKIQTEVSILRNLAHPHIVALLGSMAFKSISCSSSWSMPTAERSKRRSRSA